MQKREGISLIVLVITIIVMIILAGVIILTIRNDDVISNANKAVDLTNINNIQQLAELKWANAYYNGLRTQKELKEYVLNELQEEGINVNEYAITVTTKGTQVIRSVIATVDGVPIPKGFVASQATGENTKAGGLVIYEGDEAVTDKNVEEAKRSRNQYVWVPVDVNTFNTNISTIKLGVDGYWEVSPATQYTSENLKYMTEETWNEAQDMYTSVKKYGGFYVARYEAGIDELRKSKGPSSEELPGIKAGTKVYSVMGKIPYNYVPWTWNNKINEDTGGLVQIARNIYPQGNANYGVVSTLMYGVQLDKIEEWIAGVSFTGNLHGTLNKKGICNAGARYYATSSAEYKDVQYDENGNSKAFNNDALIILTTGALKDAKANNIYDLVGNMWEATMEGQHTYRRGLFGMGYSNSVSNNTSGRILARGGMGSATVQDNYSFRVTLYIK